MGYAPALNEDGIAGPQAQYIPKDQMEFRGPSAVQETRYTCSGGTALNLSKDSPCEPGETHRTRTLRRQRLATVFYL